MKFTFLTDLDGTVLFSKKRLNGKVQLVNADNGVTASSDDEPDIICVEQYNGDAFGYMLKTTYDTLNRLHAENKLDIIPVTTRSQQQYGRINLPDCVKSAYVTNGTILVAKNNESAWIPVCKLTACNEQKMYNELCSRLQADERVTSSKVVDDMFAYACCRNIADAADIYADVKSACPNQTITQSGRKVYITESWVTKAVAVQDVRHYDKENCIIAAGDSLLDIPMLIESDYAIVPTNEMESMLRNEIERNTSCGHTCPVKHIYNAHAGNDPCVFSNFINHILCEITR